MSISGVVGGREGGGGEDGVVVVGGTGVGRWIGLHRRCSGPQLAFISHCFAFFPRAWRICPAFNLLFRHTFYWTRQIVSLVVVC